MIEIESLEHLDEILASAQDLIVLDFYGATCGPCRKIAPLLEEIAEIYEPDVTFCKVLAQQVMPAFVRYQISSVPCILIMKKSPYGSDPEIKARLVLKDMTKENLMGLISEYKNITLN